jgi:4-hydroxy-3-methylbut-2-enyl diphosphate reductase IspH
MIEYLHCYKVEDAIKIVENYIEQLNKKIKIYKEAIKGNKEVLKISPCFTIYEEFIKEDKLTIKELQKERKKYKRKLKRLKEN